MIAVQRLFFAVLVAILVAATAISQPATKSAAIPPVEDIPVLIKHLPDWEAARDKAVFATTTADLKKVLGERPILDQIDLSAGMEAVTAPYDAGKLLIVEYATPQGASEDDAVFKKAVAGDSSTVYRRIGNYNVFVFDVVDEAAANALLDQISYDKEVQWLGENPFEISAERFFVLRITDIFLSTFLFILLGVVFSITVGAAAGYLYFRWTDQRRAGLSTFSDAGGMTRLNLDGFTPENRLLEDRSR